MRADDFDSRDPDERLLDVADRIGSGERVDFEALARALADDERGVLKSLRTLSAIHQLHTAEELPAPPQAQDASDFRAEPGGTWGSLELIEEIGRGSYGSVWRAHDRKLDREVALKLLRPGRELDPDDRARFLEEGRCLARVDHEHVVRVHGVDEAADRLGLWMERVRGRTLAAILAEQGRFSAEEAAILGEKIARGLSAVHAAGVVHRDVKAQNVMRADGGRVVLMDFGTAVESGQDATSVEGTPFYLAPELFERAPADARSDVYALGVLLYHMVTASFPVQTDSVADLARAHRDGARVPLASLRADLPTGYVEIVERALAPDPRDRFQTAGEMAQALAGLGRATVTTPSAPATPVHRRSVVSRRVILGALGALAAVVAFTLLRPTTPLGVDASFLRFGDFSTEELFTGATVHVDDQLGLRLTPTHEAWVYVFNRDAQGRFHVMFPHPAFDRSNPLPPETTTELPGTQDGEASAWAVDSVGGEEQVLMVVSDAPIADIEARLASAGASASFDTPQLEGLRGIGGVVRRRAAAGAEGSGDFFDAVEALGQTASTSDSGVWIRKIVLRNPG